MWKFLVVSQGTTQNCPNAGMRVKQEYPGKTLSQEGREPTMNLESHNDEGDED